MFSFLIELCQGLSLFKSQQQSACILQKSYQLSRTRSAYLQGPTSQQQSIPVNWVSRQRNTIWSWNEVKPQLLRNWAKPVTKLLFEVLWLWIMYSFMFNTNCVGTSYTTNRLNVANGATLDTGAQGRSRMLKRRGKIVGTLTPAQSRKCACCHSMLSYNKK